MLFREQNEVHKAKDKWLHGAGGKGQKPPAPAGQESSCPFGEWHYAPSPPSHTLPQPHIPGANLLPWAWPAAPWAHPHLPPPQGVPRCHQALPRCLLEEPSWKLPLIVSEHGALCRQISLKRRKRGNRRKRNYKIPCCSEATPLLSKVGCINIDLAGICPTFICTDIINVLENEKSILFSWVVTMYSQECVQIMQITVLRLAT